MCEAKRSFLDPRTKIVLIITVSGLLIQCGLSVPGLISNAMLLCVPLAFYLSAHRYKKAIGCGTVYASGLLLLAFVFPKLSGTPAILLSAACALLIKIMPGVAFGLHVISTIEAADLIAALDKMHLPKALTWTISMVFRFFPTVGEELSATWDGVRMRGHTVGYCLLHPISTLVDVFVPLIVSVVNIGDELLMATLTKGFSVHAERTSISVPRLYLQDYCALLLCAAGWAVQFMMK